MSKKKYLEMKHNILYGGQLWAYDTNNGSVMYDNKTREIINQSYQQYMSDNTNNLLVLKYEASNGDMIKQSINFNNMMVTDLHNFKMHKLNDLPLDNIAR